MKNLLQSFCGNDELREWVNSPFTVNDLIVATDDILLIYTQKGNADFACVDRPNKIKAIERLIEDSNVEFNISTTKLTELIGSVPTVEDVDKVGDDIECDACVGYGEVDFSYEYNLETYERSCSCPVCDGNGLISESKEVPNGKMVIDPYAVCSIGNSVFNCARISKLLDVAKFEDADNIKLIFQFDPLHQTIFEIGRFKVLIMPTTKPNEEAVFELD